MTNQTVTLSPGPTYREVLLCLDTGDVIPLTERATRVLRKKPLVEAIQRASWGAR